MHLGKEIEITTKLLQICDEDGRDDIYVASIRSCLRSLQEGNAGDAAKHFCSMPLAGMGHFGDWYFKATNAYVLESTVARWVELMRPHVAPPRCPCCGRLRHNGPCFEYMGD